MNFNSLWSSNSPCLSWSTWVQVGPTLRVSNEPMNAQKVYISSTAQLHIRHHWCSCTASMFLLSTKFHIMDQRCWGRRAHAGKIPRVQQRTYWQKNQEIWSVPWRKWRVSVIPAVVHPSSQMQFWSGSSCLSRNCQNAKRFDTNCTKRRKRTNSPRGPWAPQLGHMICSCHSSC